MSPEQEVFLRRLAINDGAVTEATLVASLGSGARLALDAVTFSLARLAALIATASPLASYQWGVDAALAAGASEADIVDVLELIGPVVGATRVTSAAPEVALALGYDLEQGPRGG